MVFLPCSFCHPPFHTSISEYLLCATLCEHLETPKELIVLHGKPEKHIVVDELKKFSDLGWKGMEEHRGKGCHLCASCTKSIHRLSLIED
jgi:hypothetical protein